jgi:putative transposase
MKGKRYTTEEKIRILREADRGQKSIQDICREENLSEVSFHRWKKQFGHMEINEARRLKELERENRELKQMLADSLLKNRVLEDVCEKKGCEPGAPPGGSATSSGCGDVFPTGRVPDSTTGSVNLRLSWASCDSGRAAIAATAA